MVRIIALVLIAFGLLIASNSEKGNADTVTPLEIAFAMQHPCDPIIVTIDVSARPIAKAEKEKQKKKSHFAPRTKHKSHVPHRHKSHVSHAPHHAPQNFSTPIGPLHLTSPPNCG